MTGPAALVLLQAAADASEAATLEQERARVAWPFAPECAGCGCVRFLGDGRCALCGAEQRSEWL